jgi:hypothetical protein
MKDIIERGYVIAQKIAPKDTYNLVLNGISRVTYEDMGEINYDNVKYIDYLENGTKRYEGAKGFIGDVTVNAIKEMIYSSMNGQFDSQAFESTYEEVSNYKPSMRTNARYLQNIGGESLE